MRTDSFKKMLGRHGWVLLLFIALAILVYWQNFFTPETLGVYAGDTFRTGYAQREFTGQAIQSGQFPFWNPYSYSGVAHFAQSEYSVFYPANWLFMLFPGVLAFKLSAAFQVVLAGFGMYLFVWRLRKGRAAAVFAGIAYALSATFLVRYGHFLIQNTLAMLPYVFFCFEGWFTKRRIRYIAYTAIAIALLFFAGHPQIFLYGMILFALYVFCRGVFCRESAKSRLTVWIFTVAALAAAILIMSAQLLSTYEMLGFSVRSLSEDLGYKMFALDEGIASKLYIGIIPLAVIILGFVAGRKARKSFHLIFFTAAAGITLLFALGDVVPLLPHLLYRVPLLGQMAVISRWTCVTAFVLCAAAGCAFPVIIKLCRRLPHPKLRAAIPLVVIGFLAVELLASSPAWLKDLYGSDVFPQPSAAVEYVKSNLKQNERFGSYRLYEESLANYYFFSPTLNATVRLPAINGYSSYAPGMYISVWNGANYFDHTAYFNPPVMNMLSERYIAAPANVELDNKDTASSIVVQEGADIRMGGLSMPEVKTLSIQSALGNSPHVPQGTAIANIRVISADGQEATFPVRAGVETSEMMYDRPDVLESILHEQAPIAQQYPVKSGDHSAFWYQAEFDLPDGLVPDTVEITYADGMGSVLQIRSFECVSASGEAYPVQAKGRRVDLELVFADAATNIAVYENHNAMPPVYAPTNLVPVGRDEVAALINAGAFDPYNTAYVYTEDAALLSGLPAGGGQVDYDYTSYRLNDLSIDVSLAQDQLVVVNENWYPGWTAEIDGTPAPIIPVNGILRGVVVPAGQHTITMAYVPTYFKAGMALTILGAGICVILILMDKKWSLRFVAEKNRIPIQKGKKEQ